MVFGQPRQEDLLAYLLERLPAGRVDALMRQARIDLIPPKAGGEAPHNRPGRGARHRHAGTDRSGG